MSLTKEQSRDIARWEADIYFGTFQGTTKAANDKEDELAKLMIQAATIFIPFSGAYLYKVVAMSSSSMVKIGLLFIVASIPFGAWHLWSERGFWLKMRDHHRKMFTLYAAAARSSDDVVVVREREAFKEEMNPPEGIESSDLRALKLQVTCMSIGTVLVLLHVIFVFAG